jgi:hypothetical protein
MILNAFQVSFGATSLLLLVFILQSSSTISPICQFDVLLQGSALLNLSIAYDLQYSTIDDISSLIASARRFPANIEKSLMNLAHMRYDVKFISDTINMLRAEEIIKRSEHESVYRLIEERLKTQRDDLNTLHIVLKSSALDMSQNLIAHVLKCSAALKSLLDGSCKSYFFSILPQLC